MNRKAQAAYFLMIGICVIILALSFVPVLKASVDEGRGNSTDTVIGLNCGDITSDWQRGTCFVSDLLLPYFFFGILAIALVVIGIKIVGGS